MPKYELTSPDGRKFRINAPEGASKEQVLSFFQSQTAPAPDPVKQMLDNPPQLTNLAGQPISVSARAPLTPQQQDVEQAAHQQFGNRLGQTEALRQTYNKLVPELNEAGQALNQASTQAADLQQKVADPMLGGQLPGQDIPVVGGVMSGVAQATLGTQGLVGRAMSPFTEQDTGDVFNRMASSVASKDEGFVNRTVAGVTRSLSTIAQQGPAGSVPLILRFAADATNSAITEGRDAGLEGKELAAYAAIQGGIEGTVTAVFQRYGFGGLEDQLYKGAIKEVTQGTMKTLGKHVGSELAEELIIEFGQRLDSYLQDVDPKSLDPGQLAQALGDVTAQTLLTMGLVEGGRRLAGGNASPDRQQAGAEAKMLDTLPEDTTPPKAPIGALPSPGDVEVREATQARVEAERRVEAALETPSSGQVIRVDAQGRAGTEEQHLAKAVQGSPPRHGNARQTAAFVAQFDPDIREGADPDLKEAIIQHFEAEAGKLRGGTGPFVKVDLPVAMVNLTDGQPDSGRVQALSKMDASTTPPALGGFDSNNKFVLVDGNTRARAAIAAGRDTIPAYVPASSASMVRRGLTPADFPSQQELRDAPLTAGTPAAKYQASTKRKGAAGLPAFPVISTTTDRKGLKQAVEGRKLAIKGRQKAQRTKLSERIKGIAAKVTGRPTTAPPRKLPRIAARKIAQAYERAQHEPNNPAVQAAYNALKEQTLTQYQALLDAGITFEYVDTASVANLYPTIEALRQDVAENNHLYVNDDPGDMPADHPLMEQVPGMDITYNQMFRAVHDIFGHGEQGHGFDIEGEENAWRDHSTMYSGLALGALTTETRAQSTWVGYGPNGEQNTKAVTEGRIGDVVFPPQKATLLPTEMWVGEGIPQIESPVEKLDPSLKGGRAAAEKAPPIEGTAHKRKVPRSVEDWITPISSRIRDISASIYNRLMRMEFDTAVHRERLKKELHNPVARVKKAVTKAGKREDFMFHVLNGEHDAARALVMSLDPNLEADFNLMITTLRNLLDNQRDAGVTIGDVPNYWPRHVKDFKSLKAEFFDDMGRFEEAWNTARGVMGRKVLTAEQKAEIANSVIQGYGPKKPGSHGPSHTRSRNIEEIPRGALKHYLDPFESLFRYIDGATYAAERARFLGKKPSLETLDDTVGSIIQEEVDAGNLDRDQQDEVHDLLVTRFTADMLNTSKVVRTFKQLIYLTTLGQFRSTLTQMTDQAITAAEHGIGATVHGLGSALRLRPRDKRFIMEDIGIHDHGEEFRDVGRVARATDYVLRSTGFKAMDRLGKETRVNAAHQRFKGAAANPTGTDAQRLRREYEPVLGEDKYRRAMADIRDGKKTEDVKYLLFLDITKVQPVTTSQMPAKYLQMPNGRIMYALKTFTIAQLNHVRRDMIRKIGTPGQRREGLSHLARYITYFTLTGMGVDWLKDWLRGRDPSEDDITDRMVDAMLGTVGLNRYTVEKAWTSPSDAAINYISPPLSWLDSAWQDMTNLLPDESTALRGLRVKAQDALARGDTTEAAGLLQQYNTRRLTVEGGRKTPLTMQDLKTKKVTNPGAGFRSFRNIPIVGELMYYWAPIGRGYSLTQEEAKTDYRAKLKELRAEAVNALRGGDTELASSLLSIYNTQRKQGTGDGRRNPLTFTDLRRDMGRGTTDE